MEIQLNDEQREVCRQAVEKFGMNAQALKVAEELRELAAEVEKWAGAGGAPSYTGLVDERADVAIMLHQLDNLLFPSSYEFKSAVEAHIPAKIEKLWWYLVQAEEPEAPPQAEEPVYPLLNTSLRADNPYASLRTVLDSAFEQAAGGKGAERHANGLPFEDQPIMQITRLLGEHPVAALAYQVVKKTVEAGRLYRIKGPDAAVREMQGTINYAAATILRLQELGKERG